MWGSLAGRVAQSVKENAGDLRSTMARIGDVVAPPPEDGDEEYEDDEEYDDEDEEYEDEETEAEYEDDDDGAPRPMGGLATALLSPFLDRRERPEFEEDDYEDDEESWSATDSAPNSAMLMTNALPAIQPESLATETLSTALEDTPEIHESKVEKSVVLEPAMVPNSGLETQKKEKKLVLPSSKPTVAAKAPAPESTAQIKAETSTETRVANGIKNSQKPISQNTTTIKQAAGVSRQPEERVTVQGRDTIGSTINTDKARVASSSRKGSMEARRVSNGGTSAKNLGRSPSTQSASSSGSANRKALEQQQEKHRADPQKKVPQTTRPPQSAETKSAPIELSSPDRIKTSRPTAAAPLDTSSPQKARRSMIDTSSPVVFYDDNRDIVDPNAKTPKASSVSPYMRTKTQQKAPSPVTEKKATSTTATGKSSSEDAAATKATAASPRKTLKPYASQVVRESVQQSVKVLSIPDLMIDQPKPQTKRQSSTASSSSRGSTSTRRDPSSKTTKSTTLTEKAVAEASSTNVTCKPEATATVSQADPVVKAKFDEMKKQCNGLERQLAQREKQILDMQTETRERIAREEEWREAQQLKFKQEQARVIEAMTESVSVEHGHELKQVKEEYERQLQGIQRARESERLETTQENTKLQRLLEEAQARIDASETDKKNALNKQGAIASQMQQRHEQALRRAEEKLAETLAQLDDKHGEVKALKRTVKELKATLSKNKQGQAETEDEMEHLRSENETLHHNWQVTEEENEELRKQIEEFESQEDMVASLKTKIKKLEESREQEKVQRESAVSTAANEVATIEGQRDEALARCRDLEHQLTAALADIEVARADTDRIMLGNANLNKALAAFQAERDAEMSLWEEQRQAQEAAANAAHAATLQATHAAHESQLAEVRATADRTVRDIQTKVTQLEAALQQSRKESVQTRRSLDEAIQRLQLSQEDVVDRGLMKNVLLDWFNKTGKGKKDVLEVMASLLHFTEEEKEKVNIYEGPGTIGKVVGAVAAPLPPAASDVDKLKGSNVREKWVNFLLAETDD